MNIKRSILLRVRVAFLFVLLFAIAVGLKIGYIQFAEGKKWKEMSERTSFDYKEVDATRGNIYSDDGSLMATSLPFYKVAFDATLAPSEIFQEGVDSLSLMLSRYFGDKSTRDYKRMLVDARAADRQYTILSNSRIDYQEKKKMMTWPIFREGRLKGGVIFEKTDVRFHPFDELSKRTIGYVNENGTGVGLEYSFNKELAGENGHSYYQKLAGGVWKPVFDANNVKAVNGLDVETTIDINLQDVAQTALHKAMVQHNADDGLVVVMEVKTGEVKAIANLSSDGHGGFSERYNYAAGGLFEPGSTFKLVTMMALLEDTNIKLTDSIDTGNGTYTFYDHTVHDHEEGGLGVISVEGAFEHSSNVAMARLADRYFHNQPQKFIDEIDFLKLSQPLGTQLVGEPKPLMKRPGQKGWSGISLPWMAYGYGIEITPLQTLALYNAVANGGKMIKPIFVKDIKNADVEEEGFETNVINRKICSTETLKKLQMLLEGVVERGTAKNINNADYPIAGKTGTAQILEDGHYTKKYITSFVGYFPADRPVYSAIVLIRNPRGWQQYGSSVAAPVFKEIADNIYSRDLSLHPPIDLPKYTQQGVFPVIRAGNQEDLAMLCNTLGVSNHSRTDDPWVRARIDGSAVDWTTNAGGKNLVPDVRGMTLRDAVYLLETAGLEVVHDGIGRVEEQSLTPGSRIAKGSKIFVKLG